MMVEWAASAAATSTIASTYATGSTVFGRHFDAHQAVLAQQADVVERELAGTVMVLRARGDLLLRDAPRNVLQHQLLFGKAEIHNTLPGT